MTHVVGRWSATHLYWLCALTETTLQIDSPHGPLALPTDAPSRTSGCIPLFARLVAGDVCRRRSSSVLQNETLAPEQPPYERQPPSRTHPRYAQHTFNIIQHTFNTHSTYIQHTFNIGIKSDEILGFLYTTVNLEVSGSTKLFILNKIIF